MDLLAEEGMPEMDEQYTAHYLSQIGMMEILGTKKGIVSLSFIEETGHLLSDVHECLTPCIIQLDEYFRGKRKRFSVPLQIRGTDFERRVWRALVDIPYGETRSYGEIAEKIGHRSAFRAVGNSNRKNRIPIVIPCRRVIGKNGALTGYACGLWRKRWLLEHEKRYR